MTNPASTESPGRWRVLALLSLAELLGMSLWFTGSAVAPELRLTWGLDAQQAGWLTGAVQLGFVAGTAAAALLSLGDAWSQRALFAGSAVFAALVNAALLLAPGFGVALLLRFLTGFFLAGVYPPAMKMIATWFRSGRGLAIGTVVGALTLGKATPYLLRALGGPEMATVVLAASAGALAGAALVAIGYRDGPFPFPRSPFRWGVVGEVIRHRPTRLAIVGYLGHMWELYAVWTWVPLFLVASQAAHAPDGAGPRLLDAVAFGAIATGALGCVAGGWAADRMGRGRWVNVAMAVSGGCCLLAAWAFAQSLWIVGGLVWVWGFFVVADSAQFSAMVTEVAPSHAVGTALMLQTSAGFLLTLATIQAVPWVAEEAGWRWAFAGLALGPAAGIAAIRRLTAPGRDRLPPRSTR